MKKVITIVSCIIALTFTSAQAQNDQEILEALGQKKSFVPQNGIKVRKYGSITISDITVVKEEKRQKFNSDKYSTVYREFTITTNCEKRKVEEVLCKKRKKGGIKPARCPNVKHSALVVKTCW